MHGPLIYCIQSSQRRLLDIANSLGLSSTVIRLVEQRTTQDKLILYGGMLVTVIIIWFLWSTFR